MIAISLNLADVALAFGVEEGGVSLQAQGQRAVEAREVVEKPLDVKGQTRNWSRLMVGRGRKEVVDFVKRRENYQQEIGNWKF